ncbi:RNA cap guanine-N2 methyltransferase [Mesonia phycicola]|uniref:RNA cap guanine-N2 methyltransferase n=1 Tax=Mesonia phycicola TaxID=579105 RepID=A0A1M6BG92_9FLAO|nr:class I SAM-dependent methyltransferase [Mesonia phycicola]SHI47725.1 RNA cap guanine-N2 methyltransferase [Mesonia phycicola]
MWNKALLKKDVQDFISANLKSNLPQLILKGSPFKDVTIQELAIQIETKRKAEKKIPSWFSTDNIIYPKTLNLEQTSSEITAKYKSSQLEGETIIDLTGGFGIDSFFFAQKFKKVTHCELNEELSLIAKHNFQKLSNKNNIEFYAGDGIEFLQNTNQNYDWIFIDPSRRDQAGGRVFRLQDCEPNVIENLDILLSKSHQGIFMKTSPLLDLSLGIKELQYKVQELQVIAVNNDVKELLWKITSKENKENTPVTCINFTKNKIQTFKTTLEKESGRSITYSNPQQYLYEANAAILKAGLFNSVAEEFHINKIAEHSHLYTSEEKIEFPGRVFKILELIPFQKKTFKKLRIQKANVTTRNFPWSVEQIRKKLNIKDGGNTYLFFTINKNNEKLIVVCEKT